MEQFYLNNVGRYHSLVDKFTPNTSATQTGILTRATTSSDLVISARIRPLQNEDVAAGLPRAAFSRTEQNGILDIHDLYNYPWGRPILKSSHYQVDKLFDSQVTNDEIFEELVNPLIECARDGGIATLFAHGQTGSGKTFTIKQLERLAIISLLGEAKLKSQQSVSISIIDLAGNAVYDLLNLRQPISILEDSCGVMQWSGVNEYPVESEEEVLDLIERADSLRQTSSTSRNAASSRSHRVCRIHIHNPEAASNGFLYFIDLAGSEAARDVVAHGPDRMRETREINMSLSVLKDCIRAKSESDALAPSTKPKSDPRRPRIPFRQSALTKVLKHVFIPAVSNESCKTALIACVNPCLADAGPSKNTMRYAEMLRVAG